MNDHSEEKPFPLLDVKNNLVSGLVDILQKKRKDQSMNCSQEGPHIMPLLIGKNRQQKPHPDDNDLGIMTWVTLVKAVSVAGRSPRIAD